MVDATEDREVKIDSLWVGATRSNLELMEAQLAQFAVAGGVEGTTFGAPLEPDPWG